MSDSPSESTQSHPLHGTDRDLIDRLLACEAPGDGELTELARLLIRYDGFPGAEDLQQDMQRLLTLWSLSREELNHQVRALWSEGYRPGAAASDPVGSGFDTSETSDG